MRRRAVTIAGIALLSGWGAGCAGSMPWGAPSKAQPAAAAPTSEASPQPDAAASDEASFVFRGARVMTAAGDVYASADVHVRGERIVAVGPELGLLEDAQEIDATGRTITPGLIDTHSHLGVYGTPYWSGHLDGNEAVRPVTAEVSAADGYWPQDPGIERARAGGVTTAQILPGSANLIGGRSFVVSLAPGARSAAEARFEGAPEGLKVACGENPKRVYGSKGGPSTRMGNVAGYRKVFQQAVEYAAKWDRYETKRAEWEKEQVSAEGAASEGSASSDSASEKEKGGAETDPPPDPPTRDFTLDSLAGVLSGEILVHNHCYRADEMVRMLELADEFGFRIRSFHHAVEAYKIADRLAASDTSASMWSDWWGFKAEAYDGIRENAAIVHAAGGRAIIHSDSAIGGQRLNQEAAKALFAGRRVGLEIDDDAALRWITANAAWALGIDDVTGSLEPGKRADLVIWSGDPFSVYTLARQVWIGGALVYDRDDPARQPRSDFETGMRPGDLGVVHGEGP